MKLKFVQGMAISIFLTNVAVANDVQFFSAGACRTANNGNGQYETLRNASWGQCKRVCLGRASCKAIEFIVRPDRTACELHTTRITHTDNSARADHSPSCWTIRGRNR